MAFITILLSLFFLFIQPVFATPVVNIIDTPLNVISSNTYPVIFTVTDIGNTGVLTFHYKVIGNGVTLTTYPNTLCGHSYDDCENLTITDTSIATATAFYKIAPFSGPYTIKIRIAKSEGHSTTDSAISGSIQSILPTPTSVAIATATATLTPKPTSTPKPTKTPVPTHTPKPTKTPSPTPTPIPTNTPKPTATMAPVQTGFKPVSPTPTINIPKPTYSAVLSESTTSGVMPEPTPTPVQTGFKPVSQKNFLSAIFISIGGLLLITPLITPTLFKWLKKQL